MIKCRLLPLNVLLSRPIKYLSFIHQRPSEYCYIIPETNSREFSFAEAEENNHFRIVGEVLSNFVVNYINRGSNWCL